MANDIDRESLLQLLSIQDAVAGTRALSTILDLPWFAQVEAEIKTGISPACLESDRAGLFATLLDWPELMALWDARLTALAGVPFKQTVIQTKFGQLRASRNDRTFRNHMFEASVLGDLAVKGVLVDVEDARTGADGVIALDGRVILIEATNTTEDILAESTGAMWVDADREFAQVLKKLRKKVCAGRQIALANGTPALLFLARTRRGADAEAARTAIVESFDDPAFAALSGVVVADSWRFLRTHWYTRANAGAPLRVEQMARIGSWYGNA